ncbi:MAG: efflux RND transporter permease subunit [Eubacterium sp.]|nr:efflux RND transporter permease subunit [Eubacterium sp.]
MTKYCVKKPFTIFVAVIAVMVIGVVSLMRMKTDLLPDMSLPYLMIITTDPGASPEKVESEVTAPMEQALGTVTGVENITSVSAENYSMITLEFVEDTNMDSAMVKVTAQLNQLELPETCGTPNMLEISMDMMATMYATVSYEDKDIYEVSDFTEEIIKPYFERQDGVASVSTVGNVEKTIEVRLNASKIDEINDKILEETNDKLAEAKDQIEEAEEQLEDGRKKLSDAKSELEKKQDDLKKAQSDTSKQLAEASLALDQAQATKAAYEANLTSLKASKAGLEAEKKAYQDNQVEEAYNQINGALGAMQTTLAQAAQLSGITIPTDVEDALANPEQTEAFVEWISQLGMEEQVKDLTIENLQQLSDIVTKRLPQIETGLANLETQILAVEQAVKQVNKQMEQIDQQYKEADSGKFQAAISMASGDAQMASGLSGMESSEKELDEAKQELKEAKKQYRQSRKAALDNANINSLANMDTLSQLITAQDFSMPAGYIKDKAQSENQWLIKVGEHYDSVENLEEMLLCKLPGVGNVRMSDVADITVIDNAGESYAKIDGEVGVLLSIFKGSTASTSEVAKTCEAAMEKLEKDYEGLKVTPIMNQGDYITMFISSILQSMISGALLAVLVLVLFFKDVKPTLVVAFSIPFSVLFAILIMYFSDISINIMTLAGLGLAIGMLVDNSIVVIENIYRIRNHGISAPRAAVQGAKQVAGPIISSTLTTICVFMPMIFTSGLVAELMVPFAMTISYALTASLVVALTVVPTAGSIMLKKTKEKSYPLFERVQSVYGRLLAFCLRFKIIPLALAILLLVLCIREVMRMGITMLPEMTGEQLSITVDVPEDTEKEEAFALADEVMEAVLAVDGVETVGAMDGSSTSGMMGIGAGGEENFLHYSFSILLDEDIKDVHKIRSIAKQIEKATADTDCEISVSSSAMGDMTAMMGSGLSLNIYGDSTEKLLEISEDVLEIVAQIKGFENISNGQEDGAQEIHLLVHKDRAMKKGLTVAQIYSTLASRLTTEKDSVTMSVGDTDMTVQIVDETELLNTDNLLEMELEATVTGDDGTTETKTYVLGDFAEIEYGQGLASISRENQSHYITVTADTMEGYNTTLLTRELNKRLKDYDLADGYTIELGGESDQVNDMVSQMMQLMALGFLLIYLVMVAQFQSLLSPFIVLFTIPLAFTGGLLGLLAFSEQLSLMSLLGFTILMGTVVNNGIVFVDYANQLRIGGMGRREALIATGKTRMRPILMTALTTILSMSMMIFSTQAGNSMGRGMAIVVVGGLLYATLMTLFIIPVMYDIFYRKQPHQVDIGEDDLDDILDEAQDYMRENEFDL